MRNLAEYPVTKDEIVAYLRQLAEDELGPDCIGSISPVLLTMAAESIQQTEAAVLDAMLAIALLGWAVDWILQDPLQPSKESNFKDWALFETAKGLIAHARRVQE